MNTMICPFCSPGPDDIVLDNEYSYARFDLNPVSSGHMLIIPKRHIQSIFETTASERTDLWDLISKAKHLLDEKFSPDGYNIGVNDGQSAGQSIMHLHIHIIPRYHGDTGDPRGGVRGVIPEKQGYCSADS